MIFIFLIRIRYETTKVRNLYVNVVQETFVLLLVLHVAKGRKEKGIEMESDRSERNRSIKIPFFSRYYERNAYGNVILVNNFENDN